MLPQLLYYLHQPAHGTAGEGEDEILAPLLDFGTIAVYTCTACCGGDGEAAAYKDEWVWVQAM